MFTTKPSENEPIFSTMHSAVTSPVSMALLHARCCRFRTYPTSHTRIIISRIFSSAGNFTSPLEDEPGSSSGLAASTEDIFHCRNNSYNELLGVSSPSPPQNPFTPETVSSPIVADDPQLKRSSSGVGQSHPYHRDSTSVGLTSPEPISRKLSLQ